MSDSSKQTPLVIGAAIALLALAAAFLPGLKDFVPALALVGATVALVLPYILPGRDLPKSTDGDTESLAQLTASRDEIIKAMSILQQEIRLAQDARKGDADMKVVRDELGRLAGEIAALKQQVLISPKPAPVAEPAPKAKPEVAKAPAVVEPAPKAKIEPAKPAPKVPAKEEDDDDFDVAPLSFDDEDEAPAPKKTSTPAPAPVTKQPAPVFEPEPVVDEKGLEPEDMEDDGDWLTGGLEEEDLVVTKKVDFESIVKKDAERPKPVVDLEEQRVLREEMEQMADSEDWVGAGLADRDVKVKKTTTNDALFDKFRAEIESKRANKESATGVRAPARGETALIANVTVPAGTKLFIRGVGPGLDVDKGAPMQQSAHGKWQWICPEPGKPCVVTLWENDQVQAEGNPVRIPGGFALTVTPTFRRKIRL